MRWLKQLSHKRSLLMKCLVTILLCLLTYNAFRRTEGNGTRNSKNTLQERDVMEKRTSDSKKTLQEGNVKEHCAAPVGGYVLNAESRTTACRIPKLDPFHPDVMKYIKELKDPLRCNTEQRVTLSGGALNIIGSDIANASYKYITRPHGNDFSFHLSDQIAITSHHNFPVPHEYVEVTLELKNGEKMHEYLMQVVPRKEITSRPSTVSELDLNILIIGIDSMSNGHAQRKLPKSYNYISDVLKGNIFKGHSVVGDGTTEQLAALLTGQGEQEYGEARRGQPNAKPVDNWNWIFKKLKGKGYLTSFLEDSPYLGSFNYRLLGFRDEPTDYYTRPFFLAASNGKNGYCIGSEKIYNYHLDFARKIYEQYSERKKFLLHFLSLLTHHNFNEPQLLDNDLLQFLKKFKGKGYLNNTVLIIMGDHGLRYGSFRQTVQGKLEERLPLFSMTFPKWFKQKYPILAKNLKTNTERLTSWFDVYATFKHLLAYPNKAGNMKHGMSLLNEVPAERSCQNASIPQHWCPCMQWSVVDRKHKHIRQAALTAVDRINSIVFHEQLGAERCSELSLLKLVRAEVETPTAQIVRFQESGHDGYEPIYSSDNIKEKSNDCKYQITFITRPNNGMFEATVHFVRGRFLVKGKISRINKYGHQPKCIAKVIPQLREYCYCK